VHRFVLSLLPRLPHRLLRLVGGCAVGQGVDGGADGGLQNLVSYRTLWTREGWDRLERRSEEAARVVFEPDGSVSVRSASVLVDPASGAARVRATVDARVSADGHAWLAATCDVRTALPSVPRVGFRLGVRRALGAAVSWLGRGPHENYDDRKLGARLAVHALDADAMHTPYIVPGENGLRCDVEWLALRDAAGGGLLLAAEPAMMAAVSPYSTAELERATHDHELCASDELTVSLDHAHMGVGGDDSWSRSVYAEHLVGAGRYTWTLGIVPLAPGDDADEAAQEALLAMPDAATTAARQARARVARRAVSAESTTGFGGCCRPC
jgi:beta-galactosidase